MTRAPPEGSRGLPPHTSAQKYSGKTDTLEAARVACFFFLLRLGWSSTSALQDPRRTVRLIGGGVRRPTPDGDTGKMPVPPRRCLAGWKPAPRDGQARGLPHEPRALKL